MKKEIEIEFKKNKGYDNDMYLMIDVCVNGRYWDHIVLSANEVKTKLSDVTMAILKFEGLTFSSYLDIPEIKALHYRHFNKQVDLFGFLENQDAYFFYDEFGRVHEYALHRYNSQHIVELKKNYNLFPSEETCANASVMSLDERKQYLFALAKGYEVLTRDEAIGLFGVENLYGLYFEADLYEWRFDSVSCKFHGSIYFKESKHAQECVDWINESEGKQ